MKTYPLMAAMVSFAVAQPTQNIVEIAANEPTLTTLVSLLIQADLVDTLAAPNPNSTDGEFTVFAPTNDAFTLLLASLEVGQSAFLLDPIAGESALSATLLYHVANGGNLPNNAALVTLSGLYILSTSSA
jgi:transforming growth factor-beta-induced protein